METQIYIPYKMERFYWTLIGTCQLYRTYTAVEDFYELYPELLQPYLADAWV